MSEKDGRQRPLPPPAAVLVAKDLAFWGGHAFEFWKNCYKHGDEAETAADDVGEGLCQKDAVSAHVEGIGEQVGQGDNDEYFSEQGEEDSLFLFI